MASTAFPPQSRSASGVLLGAIVGVLGLLAVAVLLFGVIGYQRWTQASSAAQTSSSTR